MVFVDVRHHVYLLTYLAPVCITCVELLTTEHILLTSSDFIERRERNFTARSARILSEEFCLDYMFERLKEISILGRLLVCDNVFDLFLFLPIFDSTFKNLTMCWFLHF